MWQGSSLHISIVLFPVCTARMCLQLPYTTYQKGSDQKKNKKTATKRQRSTKHQNEGEINIIPYNLNYTELPLGACDVIMNRRVLSTVYHFHQIFSNSYVPLAISTAMMAAITISSLCVLSLSDAWDAYIIKWTHHIDIKIYWRKRGGKMFLLCYADLIRGAWRRYAKFEIKVVCRINDWVEGNSKQKQTEIER